MADRLTLVKLSKHFGANNPGEVCSFTAPVAAHIVKHAGGTVLGEFEVGAERYDAATGKIVKIGAPAK